MRAASLVFLWSLFLFACQQPGSAGRESNKPTPFTPAMACTLSEITYCPTPEDSIARYLPDWKIIWSPPSVRGNYAFIATDGNNYAVAVRGSLLSFTWDAFNNWIYQDMNVATQENWPYTDTAVKAKISSGAYSGWQNMMALKDTIAHKTMRQVLDSVITPTTPLYFTGHSLGGNLATVFASWFYNDLKKMNHTAGPMNVITFAAPAAGNTAFATDFNRKFPAALRYENKNDMVPKFPLADEVGNLGRLFDKGPSAGDIMVGYKSATVSLSTVFTTMQYAIKGLEIFTISAYRQPCGGGTQLDVPLSGKNNGKDAAAWFAEAGYQHSVEQYARAVGAPVIHTE